MDLTARSYSEETTAHRLTSIPDSSTLAVQEIRDDGSFYALEQPWNQLVEQCKNRHLFQRHEWQ